MQESKVGKCNILGKCIMKDERNKKRTGIARAGAKLFSKKGFAETSMDDIAAAARLSKGGIYHYGHSPERFAEGTEQI